ncbi:hypothetical protein CBR_g36238 [Chara braunii]|uniref:Uncharacterized protein n=2 Tax=Chara braunii TaxID=69332 RepID=A0A388LK81_CHABU|nr:hypothetical protein CBR_g36238 [Chara braunii]|eukprot:GBG82709.1 hypothetical protein CBR_g36238 [Chara braunii]
MDLYGEVEGGSVQLTGSAIRLCSDDGSAELEAFRESLRRRAMQWDSQGVVAVLEGHQSSTDSEEPSTGNASAEGPQPPHPVVIVDSTTQQSAGSPHHTPSIFGLDVGHDFAKHPPTNRYPAHLFTPFGGHAQLHGHSSSTTDNSGVSEEVHLCGSPTMLVNGNGSSSCEEDDCAYVGEANAAYTFSEEFNTDIGEDGSGQGSDSTGGSAQDINAATSIDVTVRAGGDAHGGGDDSGDEGSDDGAASGGEGGGNGSVGGGGDSGDSLGLSPGEKTRTGKRKRNCWSDDETVALIRAHGDLLCGKDLTSENMGNTLSGKKNGKLWRLSLQARDSQESGLIAKPDIRTWQAGTKGSETTIGGVDNRATGE